MNTADSTDKVRSSPGTAAEAAGLAYRALAAAEHRDQPVYIVMASEAGLSPSIQLPPEALAAIEDVLRAMSQGLEVAVIQAPQELSTQDAANYLNVSRPFIVKEIEAGRLPCRKVGTHRRIEFSELMKYAAKMRTDRDKALDDLAASSRELGLEY
ncbi:helix-turn-helix domain-containing protein [Ideonella azotifigens]|nr:helix-turn-helix domain-containing protein [Ideonella azotifigens]MCD2342560.1 helix-turn-helix domain-containing protein [Ideonella azotifigens]